MVTGDSSLWAIGGFGIWIAVLGFPLLVYFLIAAFQKNKPNEGPHVEVGERLDQPGGKAYDQPFDQPFEEPSNPVQKDDEIDRKTG